MIKPTVGRVVLYTPDNDPLSIDATMKRNGKEPFAAIVCAVHSDRLVNLAVFDGNGVPWQKPSVSLIQPEDAAISSPGMCHWMPYQKEQAAKAEALEKKLEEAEKQ